GDRLGHVGVYALALSAAVTAVVLFRRAANPLAPLGGAVVVVACWPFYVHHVFPYRGVLAMAAIGVGLGLLELGRDRRPA
ncbi:MAG: hypothetical protein JWN17_1799, partial [Frankiales bacterium]|nr:hypothetical protein [Frankiales bacterium]